MSVLYRRTANSPLVTGGYNSQPINAPLSPQFQRNEYYGSIGVSQSALDRGTVTTNRYINGAYAGSFNQNAPVRTPYSGQVLVDSALNIAAGSVTGLSLVGQKLNRAATASGYIQSGNTAAQTNALFAQATSYDGPFANVKYDMGGQAFSRTREEKASGYQDLFPDLYNQYTSGRTTTGPLSGSNAVNAALSIGFGGSGQISGSQLFNSALREAVNNDRDNLVGSWNPGNVPKVAFHFSKSGGGSVWNISF